MKESKEKEVVRRLLIIIVALAFVGTYMLLKVNREVGISIFIGCGAALLYALKIARFQK